MHLRSKIRYSVVKKTRVILYLYTVFYFRNIVRITFWRSSLFLTIKCFVWCFMWVWKYSYSIAEKYITRVLVSYTYDPIIFIFHSKIKRCIKIISFNQKEFWYTSNLIPKITSIFWFPKSGFWYQKYILYLLSSDIRNSVFLYKKF